MIQAPARAPSRSCAPSCRRPEYRSACRPARWRSRQPGQIAGTRRDQPGVGALRAAKPEVDQPSPTGYYVAARPLLATVEASATWLIAMVSISWVSISGPRNSASGSSAKKIVPPGIARTAPVKRKRDRNSRKSERNSRSESRYVIASKSKRNYSSNSSRRSSPVATMKPRWSGKRRIARLKVAASLSPCSK